MLPVGIGLGAAASIAFSSTAAGLASRRLTPVLVGFWSQVVQLTLCAALLLLLRPVLLDGQTFWGLCAGVAGGIGMSLNYRAMAVGAISLVAPITACSIVIPVAYSVLVGESLTSLAVVGIVAIIAGVVVASLQSAPIPEDPTDTTVAGDRRAVMLAIGAALAYGAFFILLDFAPDAQGIGALWTAGAVRVAGVSVQIALVLYSRRGAARPGAVAPFILLSAMLDFASLMLISFGTMTESYALVTALVGLYPLIAVLIGVVLLGERLTRLQSIGAVLAVAGVLLVSI